MEFPEYYFDLSHAIYCIAHFDYDKIYELQTNGVTGYAVQSDRYRNYNTDVQSFSEVSHFKNGCS